MASFVFGAALAAFVTLIGTHDLENYDRSFFSLDRGSRMETIKVLGQPVYTLAIGLGVRLPLHGNLSASPAAILAPHLPEPITYWLLLTLAIGTAAFIVRYALEPICGRSLCWFAIFLLFFSLPVLNYTITDDWPETAVTYFTIIASVFVPHALLTVSSAPLSVTRRLLALVSLLGVFWGVMAISHPGYWPLIGVTLVCSAALVAIRTDHPLRNRLAVVAALAVVSCVVVALLAPDIVRELWVAGNRLEGMKRFTEGPRGGLWASNVPWLDGGARRPFTFLLMTLTSLAVGVAGYATAHRQFTVGSALASLAFGIAASSLPAGTSAYAPSTTWALRDPAIGFAVLSAACAAQSLTENRITRVIGVRTLGVMLFLGASLGPWGAVDLLFKEGRFVELFDTHVAPRGTTPPQDRIFRRGLPRERVAVGSRIAFWPGVAEDMRRRGVAQAEFADAGYVLVTAMTKQRTMRGLVEPNDTLFAQSTYLPSAVLCDPTAVSFLELNYLLVPSTAGCHAWRIIDPPLAIEHSFVVQQARDVDARVWALPSAEMSDVLRREPAFSQASSLLSALTPLADTSITLGPKDIVVRQIQPSLSAGLTMVFPVAYDSAWVPSSGRTENVGGLMALNGAHDARIVLSFAPDTTSILRSAVMVLSQLFTCIGLIGLANLAPVATPAAVRVNVAARRQLDACVLWFRHFVLCLGQFAVWLRRSDNRPDPLYVGYCAVMFFTLQWHPEASNETSLVVALLLPVTGLVVTRLTRTERAHEWLGRLLLTIVIIRVLMRGSRAYEAAHDPLFWAIIATVGFAVSLAAARRLGVARMAASLAGATAMLATMLPLFPRFDSEFPKLNADIIQSSLHALSYQMGAIGTMLLLVLWGRAITRRANAWDGLCITSVMARAALLVALLLCLAGTVPSPKIDARWTIALGVLIGLATPRTRVVGPTQSNDGRHAPKAALPL